MDLFLLPRGLPLFLPDLAGAAAAAEARAVGVESADGEAEDGAAGGESRKLWRPSFRICGEQADKFGGRAPRESVVQNHIQTDSISMHSKLVRTCSCSTWSL